MLSNENNDYKSDVLGTGGYQVNDMEDKFLRDMFFISSKINGIFINAEKAPVNSCFVDCAMQSMHVLKISQRYLMLIYLFIKLLSIKA